jgi:hypothetical protein
MAADARTRSEAASYAGDYRNLRRPYFRTEQGLYDLLIASLSVSAAPNGDLHVRSLLDGPPPEHPSNDHAAEVLCVSAFNCSLSGLPLEANHYAKV